MLHIDKSFNIDLTRGDTGLFNIILVDKDGDSYTPPPGSTLRFAMAKQYYSEQSELLIEKQIPISTMQLEIEPQDTKNLKAGKYLYDIELTDDLGRVSTVVMATFTVSKEVY